MQSMVEIINASQIKVMFPERNSCNKNNVQKKIKSVNSKTKSKNRKYNDKIK